MLFFLELLVSAYVIYLIVMSFLVYRTIPKGWRGILLWINAVTPFLFVFFAFKSIFVGNRQHIPYSEKLSSTEEIIESKRVEIFGGERLSPSISAWWRVMYLSSLERTVREAKKIAGFSTTAEPVHR